MRRRVPTPEGGLFAVCLVVVVSLSAGTTTTRGRRGESPNCLYGVYIVRDAVVPVYGDGELEKGSRGVSRCLVLCFDMVFI